MKYSDLDKNIKSYLKKETVHAEKQKGEAWENIQNELFSKPKMRRRNRKNIFRMATAAAIILFIWAGLLTTPGQALVQELKDMFVSEKDIELEIEGQKEDTHVELETNEALRYVIYVDTSRYKLVEGESSDKILPVPEIGEEYPEVSMEIIRQEGISPEELITTIKQELTDLNMDIRQEETTDAPVESVVIRAIGEGYTNEHGKTGEQWDTPIYKYYVTNEQNGQFYVIKQMYFIEAAEGHGVRLDSMLESFEIVPIN